MWSAIFAFEMKRYCLSLSLVFKAILLCKQDNPSWNLKPAIFTPFYEITSQHKHGNLGLSKKQWERNVFSAPVGIALHCLRNAGEDLKVNIWLWDIVLVLLQNPTPQRCLCSVLQNIYVNLILFLNWKSDEFFLWKMIHCKKWKQKRVTNGHRVIFSRDWSK